MLAKENGWILAIDQASNAAGCSLWNSGTLIAANTLKSIKSTDPIGRRLAAQVVQLDAWLESYLLDSEIKQVIFEGVRSRLVLVTVGAFTCSKYLQNCRLHARHTFVESISWKRWAQKRGATGPLKDIKGLKALAEAGWDMARYPVSTDDEADSVMIYQTWKERK